MGKQWNLVHLLSSTKLMKIFWEFGFSVTESISGSFDVSFLERTKTRWKFPKELFNLIPNLSYDEIKEL